MRADNNERKLFLESDVSCCFRPLGTPNGPFCDTDDTDDNKERNYETLKMKDNGNKEVSMFEFVFQKNLLLLFDYWWKTNTTTPMVMNK